MLHSLFSRTTPIQSQANSETNMVGTTMRHFTSAKLDPSFGGMWPITTLAANSPSTRWRVIIKMVDIITHAYTPVPVNIGMVAYTFTGKLNQSVYIDSSKIFI